MQSNNQNGQPDKPLTDQEKLDGLKRFVWHDTKMIAMLKEFGSDKHTGSMDVILAREKRELYQLRKKMGIA